MATVSGNFRFTQTAILLASVFVTGCNSVMPVKPQAAAQTSHIPTTVSLQPLVTASSDTPLPRQTYNAAGEKVAYVPQPNPYITEVVSVPPEAKVIFSVADTRLKRGDLEVAKMKFTMLTEKYPSLSGPWLKLGAIAEAQEKYPEAIEHYKRAISVNRNNVNAYIALGLLQRKQGYFSDAFNTYHDALMVWRDFPEAHLNLAILYDLYLNNPEEAQKHYEAYYFLTGENNEKVQKWLVEVRHRTGIKESFIDTPPANVARTPVNGSGGTVDVTVTNGAK
ncbi:MAG: tetratricopeptide repeat protein [Gammaproteobacteria bacterium]|jgi:tetratricopeptide (TPR) repeat protein